MISKYVLLFLLLNSAVILGCRIDFKVRSLTNQPFEFETMIPGLGKHTERALFEGEFIERKALVEGKNCQDKPWILRTYRKKANGEFEKAHEVTAKFDGEGELNIGILNDLLIRVESRAGVACSETLICG